MKPLQLWLYTATILGQHRLVLVADHTVGGAKGRLPMNMGVPSSKTGIPVSAKGFPAWITAPGVWIGIVPVQDKTCPRAHDLAGLDRYSQERAEAPPKILPDKNEAFVYGAASHDVLADLETLVNQALEARFSKALYKTA